MITQIAIKICRFSLHKHTISIADSKKNNTTNWIKLITQYGDKVAAKSDIEIRIWRVKRIVS